MIENTSVKVEFLENKTGEITARAYLLSISEIVNGVQQTGTGVLLTVNNYILGPVWGIDSTYPSDSQSEDKNHNLPSSGRAVFLKFDTLHSLENYIK